MKKLVCIIFILIFAPALALAQTAAASYPKAALPVPSEADAGRLVRLTDGNRGLYMNTGTEWVSVNGGVFDVRMFGAKGDGKFDDTEAFQTAITAAVREKGATVFVPKPAVYYKLAGTLTIPPRSKIIIRGTNTPDSADSGLEGGIIFTGGGQAARITARSTLGVALVNLKIGYTNPSMTGYIVDFSRLRPQADTHYPAVEECEFFGFGEGVNRAAAHLNFNEAIIGRVEKSFFSGAQIGIVGVTTGSYSNGFVIKGNTFLHNVASHVRNGHTNWTIEDNIFESLSSGKAGGYDETIVSYSPVIIRNNYFGDVSAAGGYFLTLSGHSHTVENNLFASGNGVAPNAPHIWIKTINGSQIEQVAFRKNTFTDHYVAVRISGASPVRRLSFEAETFLPHGSVQPVLVQTDAGAPGVYSLDVRGMDYEGIPTKIPSLESAVDIGGAAYFRELTNKERPQLTALYQVPNTGYAALGIFGASRLDGITNPIGFYTTTDLSQTFAPSAINTIANTLTVDGGFSTGEPVYVSSSVGKPPAPFSLYSNLFVRRTAPSVFTFHPTRGDALAGTNTIDLTTQGAGTMTMTRVAERRLLIDETITATAPLRIGENGTATAQIRHGRCTLVAGVCVITDKSVTANTNIFVNRQTDSGIVGASYSITRAAGASFTITGKKADGTTATADASVVAWQSIEP